MDIIDLGVDIIDLGMEFSARAVDTLRHGMDIFPFGMEFPACAAVFGAGVVDVLRCSADEARGREGPGRVVLHLPAVRATSLLCKRTNGWTQGFAGQPWRKWRGAVGAHLPGGGFGRIEVEPARCWIKTFAGVAE